MVELGGMPQKVKVAHFHLSYSRKPFVIAYPRESLEMVLDAHCQALRFYKGIPRKVIIDNPKIMVSAIGVGKGREFNTRFLAMMNLYLIEPMPIAWSLSGTMKSLRSTRADLDATALTLTSGIICRCSSVSLAH